MLFEGEEVFATSPSPTTCTVGVWAAFQPSLGLVVLDTEGLLGATTHQNRRMRLLLKVLAVSDIVVYRTRAERLHNDMFQFLGSASAAYLRYFTPQLRALSNRCGLDVPLSSLGPAVIVFQETSRTQLLGQGKVVGTSPMGALQMLKLSPDYLCTCADACLSYLSVYPFNPNFILTLAYTACSLKSMIDNAETLTLNTNVVQVLLLN